MMLGRLRTFLLGFGQFSGENLLLNFRGVTLLFLFPSPFIMVTSSLRRSRRRNARSFCGFMGTDEPSCWPHVFARLENELGGFNDFVFFSIFTSKILGGDAFFFFLPGIIFQMGW